GGRPWDFRFGKTAYGYMNKAIRFGDTKTADTTVIDTTTYDQDMDGIKDDKVITQERPNWMANEYHYRYGSETINDKDIMLVDLTTSGQINIRIDSSDAFKLLTPVNQINKDYNTHALFTIVANDGHAGVNAQTMKVYINVKPTIVTTTLPPAKEDIDYNPELLDTNKRIAVFDPNMDQGHTFELIYPGYGQNLIPKDPCYPEAGNWDVTTMKTTPNWLKINKESGLLYGTPRVKDAPDNAKITVLVTDEGGLTEVKQFDMTVEETNHLPHLINPPTTKCVEKGKSYVDTIYVRDMDLLRGNKQGDKTEHLTIKVNKPSSNISVSPSDTTGIFAGQAVNGKFNEKDYTFKVVVRSNNFDPPLDKDGKATIEVQVTDAAGEIYIISYKVQISEATDFTCPILIENNLGAEQILEFGTGSRATAGDGLDNEENGKLDSNYCEYELPPLPPVDVFDARWTINTRQGIARNIFRTGRVGDPQERRYVGKLQPGGENGQTSPAYPITLTWKMSDVPLITNTTTNPSGATWWIRDALSNGSYFSVNMNTGQGNHNDKVDLDNTLPNNSCMLRIKTNVIESFVIVHDWISPVNEQPTGMPNEYSIVKASPNPTSSTTEITIGLPQTNYVNIHVIDNLGNIVTTISSHARFDAGYATILWNGENVASGAYTLRMVAGNTTSVYPIVIVK
ncbi:MAG: hypothetical protein QG635_1889, partial [Bacteroidota bacterium]|nr:hypothetical protein [Bacteroidota bacterium]